MTPIAPAGGWHAALAGALLDPSLAAPPRPVMAIMVSASLHGRVRQAFLTACGAISADLCWLGLSILGVHTVSHAHPRWLGYVGLAGPPCCCGWPGAPGPRPGAA